MAEKILIIGPSWVGDMVMAQSLFKLLKMQDEKKLLHVLAPAWTFSLLNRMPEVEKAIEMPFNHGELKLRERYQLAKILQRGHYDQAIVLPNSLKSALIPWLARIPKRTGWVGEWRYPLLNDIRHLDKKMYPLMVEQYLALGLKKNEAFTKPYPLPEFKISKASQENAVKKYQLQLNSPVLALCPGAEFGPSKRWPLEYYAEVAKQKIADGWKVWLLGSLKDEAVTAKIMQLTENRCINLAGQTTLEESIDLLSLVTGMVTNDSGLMHIGAALKKPLVVIYGSTSPFFTPPLSESAKILQRQLSCQPCFERSCPLQHHRCMRDIKPEQVLAFTNTWS